MMASSGGVAGVAADIGVEEGVHLPDLVDLEEWVRERVPGDGSLNPLDLTGFVMRDRALLHEMFSGYAAASGVDALVLVLVGGRGRRGVEPHAARAVRRGRRRGPDPAHRHPGRDNGGRRPGPARYATRASPSAAGCAPPIRALRALDDVARAPAPRLVTLQAPASSAPPPLIDSPVGPIVGFADAMDLLAACGVAVAPYVVIDPGSHTDQAVDAAIEALGDRLVVKLADVPHRTELGAVRVGVAPGDVADAVADMRQSPPHHGLPATVAVQAMVAGHGEAFIGLQGHTDLGPVVVFGRGGVLVEVAGRVGGRLLPLGPGAAIQLVDEMAGAAAFAGLRGQQPWAPAPLVAAIEAVAELWRRAGSWLGSADLNPLIVTGSGPVAVDALLVASESL